MCMTIEHIKITHPLFELSQKQELAVRPFDQSEVHTFRKESGSLGSNPGGWYRDLSNDQRWYLKFYQEEDRTRMEHWADRCYQQAGLCVPQSSLFFCEEATLSFGSKEIQGSLPIPIETLQRHPDVRAGFLMDVYLNNWDVIGEFLDNMLFGTDGRIYRLDQGGCGPFRALRGMKPFRLSVQQEVNDMRNPTFDAGKIFQDITKEEIEAQSRHLLQILTDEFLIGTIRSLGFSVEIETLLEMTCLQRRDSLSSLIP